MALSRRATRSVNAAIWPGFVDAMTALLLVMMFLLTIFMVVQFVLREEISGQRSQLDTLASEVSGLSAALGRAEERAQALTDERDALRSRSEAQSQRIEEQGGRIASFEEQVASLLTARDTARQQAASLAESEARLISDQEALNLALAQARDEIDAAAEEARLAAARREALEALTADLRADLGEAEGEAAELVQRVNSLETSLSDEEARRVVEAAAADALRERLANSEAELSAMTLALEEERARAEETLTLLAAARRAEEDLDERLTAALIARDGARSAQSEAEEERDRSAELLAAALSRETEQDRELASIADALDQARAARLSFEGDLEAARAALAETEARVEALREDAGREADERDRLAAALVEAREEAAALDAAAESRASDLRAQLEEALALKLAAENRAAERMSDAERQAALLATANAELRNAETAGALAEREMEALNQQVARLREDVATLSELLDLAETEREAQDIEIDTLGERLNAALVREAEEQRRRAELEAAERERLEGYQSEFFGRLRGLLEDRDGVEIVGDRFVFDSEVLFPSGSADLSAAGEGQVAQVAALLEDVAGEIPDGIDWVIRVDGHTDDVPLRGSASFADNWELSQARALSVVRFMSDELGFPADRLAPTGFGEFQPIDTAGTAEARARNRRIELKLTER
ncbi:peptidoglycan -binding protein [Palleronia sp. LCG004]|uniref:peptidoglycan -binding protein n=1 Tax=Palleronia sp. LCG004 TaxID=3079304 RepID=UPI00294256E8|nr:peptidoglycan -binding protein [Palleronia sp. LCG004]WOI56967.1 peptidoglycan -binding protein [Palleronia sp. LCG004]